MNRVAGWDRNAPLSSPRKALTCDTKMLNRNKALPPISEDLATQHWSPKVLPWLESPGSPRSWQRAARMSAAETGMRCDIHYSFIAGVSPSIQSPSHYDDGADDMKFAHLAQVVHGEKRRPMKNKYHSSTWSINSEESHESVWKKMRTSVFPCVPTSRHAHGMNQH